MQHTALRTHLNGITGALQHGQEFKGPGVFRPTPHKSTALSPPTRPTPCKPQESHSSPVQHEYPYQTDLAGAGHGERARLLAVRDDALTRLARVGELRGRLVEVRGDRGVGPVQYFCVTQQSAPES